MRSESPRIALGLPLRPWAFSTGSWKSFLNAPCGFALHGLACESALRYSPDPGYSPRSLLLFGQIREVGATFQASTRPIQQSLPRFRRGAAETGWQDVRWVRLCGNSKKESVHINIDL